MRQGGLGRAIHDLLRTVAPAGGTGLADARLLERFVRERDEGAFEALLWRHGPMVQAVCRRLLGHEQDAEDALQATFLVLYRKAAGIGRGAAISGWLHRVACRVALRARARAARQPRPGLPLEERAAPDV